MTELDSVAYNINPKVAETRQDFLTEKRKYKEDN
jgi:hypothetical protein